MLSKEHYQAAAKVWDLVYGPVYKVSAVNAVAQELPTALVVNPNLPETEDVLHRRFMHEVQDTMQRLCAVRILLTDRFDLFTVVAHRHVMEGQQLLALPMPDQDDLVMGITIGKAGITITGGLVDTRSQPLRFRDKPLPVLTIRSQLHPSDLETTELLVDDPKLAPYAKTLLQVLQAYLPVPKTPYGDRLFRQVLSSRIEHRLIQETEHDVIYPEPHR